MIFCISKLSLEMMRIIYSKIIYIGGLKSVVKKDTVSRSDRGFVGCV